jgi:porphobilinogen synthase
MSDDILNLIHRPRRLRTHPQLRQMLQRVVLHRSDFIVPVFVTEGIGIQRPIPSMPDVYQMSIDIAVPWLSRLAEQGFYAFLVFGLIDRDKKDSPGSEALNAENVVCNLLQKVKQQKIPMLAITDLCFCEYTDHGHCGPISEKGSTVANDQTVNQLVLQAINHARAGADVIAPSGMMDGTVGAVRAGLDAAGFTDVAILSYSVKYASAFYGPFRDAADCAPAFGDRRSYQMDPARGPDEAILEMNLDLQQGADLVMVKPAGAYLDIIAAVRAASSAPVVAYQVSGEYAMIEAAVNNGWLDGDRARLESLLAIKRAGADLIISYYAERLVNLIER